MYFSISVPQYWHENGRENYRFSINFYTFAINKHLNNPYLTGQMKFKVLYGWYIAIVAVMLFSACIKISNIVKGFADGYSAAYENVSENIEKSDAAPMVWAGTDIKIAASDLKDIEFPIKLERDGTGDEVELTPLAYAVMASGDMGSNPKIMALSALQLFAALVVLVLFVMVLVYIVKLFIRINAALKRKEIFDIKVIRTMRLLGWLLLAQAVVNTLFSYIQAVLGDAVLSGYGINVIFSGEIDYTKFLLAFVTVMISEIFEIGHSIQEEQSLTI